MGSGIGTVDAYKMGELIDMNVQLTIGWGGGLGLLKQHRTVLPLTRLQKPKFALTRTVVLDYKNNRSSEENNNNNNEHEENMNNDDDDTVTAIQLTFEDTYWVLPTLSTIIIPNHYAIMTTTNHPPWYR